MTLQISDIPLAGSAAGNRFRSLRSALTRATTTAAQPPPVSPVEAPVRSTQTKPTLWGFLWPMLREYRWLLVAALALSVLHGFSVTFQTVVPAYLIDWVILPVGLSTHQRIGRMAILTGLYLLASVFGRMLVWHAGYRLFTLVREKLMFTLRANFFRHVNHLCVRFHLKHHSGELFSYLFGSPVGQLQTYFQQFTFGAPGAVAVLVSTVLWLAKWDWVLTAVVMGTVLATAVVMQWTRKRVQRLNTEYQNTETSVTGQVADLLRGSRDVKLYAMEQKVATEFNESIWEVGRQAYRRDVQSHVQYMKFEVVNYVCFAILCVAVAWRYQYGHAHKPVGQQLTIGNAQAYLMAFISLQGQLALLFQLSTFKAAAQAGVERIQAVLDTASTTPDPIGDEAPVPSRGAIELRNVTFGYTAETPVLRNVNLTIPYGQRVALVGPSGAGKSTITQLLLRLYDPLKGSVCVGGQDVRQCRGPELRRRFGVVPQDPFIFRTTIRENLRVARAEATDAELRAACERANAWEFIARLPEGLDSTVGEGGATLSGGQRQRLAIARALVAEPDFFIFDEATSALDTVSEQMVQQAMENAMDVRTALVIAHRLATVKNCDRILVLNDGRIVQDGTYAQLLEEPGLFQQLVHGQAIRH